MEYSKNSIYIVGCAKAAAENPITVASQYLILPIIFDRDSGQIYDADINSVCDITERFVKSLLVGRSIYTDYNAIIQDIGSRYLGHSQKALYFLYPKYHSYSSGAEHASAALWLIFYFSLDILLSIFYTDAKLSYLYIVQNYLLAR